MPGEVVGFRGALPSQADTERELWLRRQAVAIAVQLPEREPDALAVLALAGELIRDFLNGPKRQS
jgi:hypothetical protein